jgi:hypothetical protein
MLKTMALGSRRRTWVNTARTMTNASPAAAIGVRMGAKPVTAGSQPERAEDLNDADELQQARRNVLYPGQAGGVHGGTFGRGVGALVHLSRGSGTQKQRVRL